MKLLTVYAPAKINLDLKILGKRSDGFHEIKSLMLPIPLKDEITIEENPVFEFVQEENLGFPPEKNLVFKVAKKFIDTFKITSGVKISLKKHIPDGAGLGGGSSDAASTLLGLQKFFGIRDTKNIIFDLAASAGSDVPFFLLNSPAIVTGRGEILKQIDFRLHGNLTVIMPDFSINTAMAYSDYDKLQKNVTATTSKYSDILTAIPQRPQLMKEIFGNSFIFSGMQHEKEIRAIISQLYAEGAVFASMSGSGAACFGFFDHLSNDTAMPKNLFQSYRIFDLKI